ncbi:MAG TPA: Ig-like domain-containing protein, partial [Flavobacterium sp.]|nr:Ig-like domain-containing protein [Flavobacterium sp.]
MFKKQLRYCCLVLAVVIVGCAKRGTITGGLKDTIAPVLKSSVPKNYTTNFTGKTIKITFDEYIKLKNVNKQLVISPPMNTAPIITPTNASKYITIKINDTLQPNTTYSFNFGQSIEDNNESIPYSQFKYIFSTGAYIDSLALSGTIKDAYDKKTESSVTVMLYEVDEKFNDSVIYKQNPRYVTTTMDSAKTFKLENLKAGKYLLVGLKDVNSNYKFNPKTEKIGFQKQYITIPNDTLYELELFKEVPKFKAYKPAQASGNRLLMGYEGKSATPKIELRKGNEPLDAIVTKFP